jgi:hypothetical protein
MSIPNAAEMLINISNTVPELMQLATALAYVGGMYLIIHNIAEMRNAPFLSSPGQGQQSVWALWRKVFIGAALMYLPSVVDVGTATFFTHQAPFAYIDEKEVGTSQIFDIAFKIIYLVGTIAVIKGLYEISHGGTSQSQDGSHHSRTHKGLMHILGGILCINLPLTLQVIFTTLGI